VKTHRCPAPKCQIEVPDRYLACRSHWFALSELVRHAIYVTARLPLLHPERRAALKAAREEWRGQA